MFPVLRESPCQPAGLVETFHLHPISPWKPDKERTELRKQLLSVSFSLLTSFQKIFVSSNCIDNNGSNPVVIYEIHYSPSQMKKICICNYTVCMCLYKKEELVQRAC